MNTIHFHIEYATHWGEEVELCYALDAASDVTHLKLNTTDGLHWSTSIQIAAEVQTLRHAYRIVSEEGHMLREEGCAWRTFHFNGRREVCFCDVWADLGPDAVFHRSPFVHGLTVKGHRQVHAQGEADHTCLLILQSAPLPDGCNWAVAGSSASLGSWNAEKAMRMQRVNASEWVMPMNRSELAEGLEYKYIIQHDGRRPSEWEQGANRHWQVSSDVSADLVRTDCMAMQQVPKWKAAGVVMPVFSLRSKESMGIGDFSDLDTFVQWAAETGMKVVQLLPINDTTTTGSWHDSYPYNCISVFALHPVYLSLREWTHTRAYVQCRAEGERLNALDEVDYEGCFALKMRFAHALYKECGKDITSTPGYRDFCHNEAQWLDSYAHFCTLRNYYHTANFRAWPRTTLDAYGMDTDMEFHRFLQYLLHRQMLGVHEHARQLGVMIKGDIPIGISPDSVPAWRDGRLFHFDGQAGAPPDDFATRGQNWGFPTYNWEEMARDGYAWWRRRLSHMSQYFDAYRIDHVLGFFRIWEVPTDQIYGVMGHFRPALPLTEEEIRGYGFHQPMQRCTTPFVSAESMRALCHVYGADFSNLYFTPFMDGFTLRQELRSQRAIERLQGISHEVREALLDLATEVLFVPDPDLPGHYHPRVSAQLTQRFRLLSEEERQAFNHLHDDFFYRRHEEFWKEEALRKLPAVTNYALPPTPSPLVPLDDTGMVPCAEDLGMVPGCVRGVLEFLHILSLEIQRMPKGWGHRFGILSENPYLSVSTIATHDMPPLRLWWKENREQTEAFWHEALGHEGEPPAEATPEICEEVVKAHLDSPSMFCLLALQDLLAISASLRHPHPEAEQINVPANPNQYWRYRMHLSLEQLIQATGFNDKLRSLIVQSGR